MLTNAFGSMLCGIDKLKISDGTIHTHNKVQSLITKYHIHCQRIHNEKNGINFVQYLMELKNKLRIESYIGTSTATLDFFFDKFQFLYEEL